MPSHVQDRTIQSRLRFHSLPFGLSRLFVILRFRSLRHLFDSQILKHQYFRALHQRFTRFVMEIFADIRAFLTRTSDSPLFLFSPP